MTRLTMLWHKAVIAVFWPTFRLVITEALHHDTGWVWQPGQPGYIRLELARYEGWKARKLDAQVQVPEVR